MKKTFLSALLCLCLTAALMLGLGACSSEGILPPKETQGPSAPLPTPSPTPMPAAFTGGIVSLEINQALSFDAEGAGGALSPMKNYVSRRSTAVLVNLDSPLGHVPDSRDYLELYRGAELLGSYSPSELSQEDRLIYLLTGEEAAALTAGEYTARGVVDNATLSRGFTLKDTRDFRILMLPIRGNYGEIRFPSEAWREYPRFMQACWPLAEDGLVTVAAPGMDLSGEEFDLRDSRGLWNAWEALRERAGVLETFDLVVGIVSGPMGSDGALHSFGRDGILLLDELQSAPAAALSHFAAQTLGAGDEYEGGYLRQESNPAPYTVSGLDRFSGETVVSHSKGVQRASAAGLRCEGSLVSRELSPFDIPGGRLLGDAASFMGSTGEDPENYWISPALWNHLFSRLSENRETPSLPQSGTGLRLTGLLGDQGLFTLQFAMTADEGSPSVTPLGNSGAYVLQLLDKEDKPLYTAAFDLDYRCPTDPPMEGSAAPFDISFPLPEGAARLELRLRDEESQDEAPEPLYVCPLPSRYPPVSSFTGLPEGEQLGRTARVDWSTTFPEPEPTGEPSEDEEAEAPPAPDPFYELYMCYDDLQLLVYRGGLRYAELDMISLPKPERFHFLLLTSDGVRSSLLESEEICLP